MISTIYRSEVRVSNAESLSRYGARPSNTIPAHSPAMGHSSSERHWGSDLLSALLHFRLEFRRGRGTQENLPDCPDCKMLSSLGQEFSGGQVYSTVRSADANKGSHRAFATRRDQRSDGISRSPASPSAAARCGRPSTTVAARLAADPSCPIVRRRGTPRSTARRAVWQTRCATRSAPTTRPRLLEREPARGRTSGGKRFERRRTRGALRCGVRRLRSAQRRCSRA